MARVAAVVVLLVYSSSSSVMKGRVAVVLIEVGIVVVVVVLVAGIVRSGTGSASAAVAASRSWSGALLLASGAVCSAGSAFSMLNVDSVKSGNRPDKRGVPQARGGAVSDTQAWPNCAVKAKMGQLHREQVGRCRVGRGRERTHSESHRDCQFGQRQSRLVLRGNVRPSCFLSLSCGVCADQTFSA